MTAPQLLEILKVTAWQQCVIGRRAAWEIREALRLDTTPPPALPLSHIPGIDWPPEAAFDATEDPSLHPRDLVRHPPFDRQNHGVWASTQLLLSAAGNVSKLLWPPRGDANEFAVDLRKLLAVDETSPLIRRTLRDSFEHIGERILHWHDNYGGTQYADSLVVESRGELPEPIPLRVFVKDEFAVIFLGEPFELNPLIAALEAVALRADPAAGTHL